MADPHWTGYVGMGTGIIALITAIATAIFNNRKINRHKALDLRLKLRTAVVDLHADLPRLNEQIDMANKSRRNLNAARGMRKSGEMAKWESQIKADRVKIAELSRSAPKIDFTYEKLDAKHLESELVEVRNIQNEIRSLLDKYLGTIRTDDELRREIRADRHALDSAKS